MKKYLVFDFETTGVNSDKKRGYKPYPASEQPLPRENYPVELSYTVLDERGDIIESVESVLIRGATRFSPFVLENCKHLDVDKCDSEGVEFTEALRRLACAADGCTLVAHNIQYDWDVIVATAKADNADFLTLKACPQFCTCINPQTKANKSSYFHKKIGKWIGPTLEKLAGTHGVKYDPVSAHKASYDVAIVVECLRKIKNPVKRPAAEAAQAASKKPRTTSRAAPQHK
jgi:DNA polymerase III alpha subunit (gram-positive type)